MRQQESQRHGKTQPHGILEFLVREIVFPVHIDMSPRDHGALLDRCEEFLPSLHTVRFRNLLREIQTVPADNGVLDEPPAAFGHLLLHLVTI
jgi:hypothetical protein